ncbi:hypothetical protein NDU88_000450, partial [Pleurodeles waltl]
GMIGMGMSLAGCTDVSHSLCPQVILFAICFFILAVVSLSSRVCRGLHLPLDMKNAL